MFKLASAAILLAAVSAVPAYAEGSDPACLSGNYAQIRTSEITKTGTLDGFKQAMADHAKWYTDHNLTADKFAWGQVLQFDAAAKQMKVVPGKLMTIHYHASEVTPAMQDAAWNAFVAEYKANSNMLTSTMVCIAN